jgi:cytochrome c oxidase accessory protein FixG
MRKLSVVLLLGLFYAVCWLSWDGQQLLLFDLPARRFHIFGLTLFPQDFVFLTLLLILAGVTLFGFTALAGRLWCGYACPQTVWTEIFVWMEQWIEGDRRRRMRLDSGPWTVEKIARKSIKHAVWITFALLTGLTFVGYFTPVKELVVRLSTFDLGPWEAFWVLFYGFATYGNAGWMREQVCIYMCPYARFQSAMFDKDTLIISYDDQRGEPRGGRRKSDDPKAKGLGDCIDCTMCVQVCPTGIDIRNGLQYQCIACAACIDACDSVMERVGYDPGLIRYSTHREDQGEKSSTARPRLFIYGAIWAGLIAAILAGLFSRVPVNLDILRDRNALYRLLDGGMVENVYTLKLTNMDGASHRFTIEVVEPGDFPATILLDGGESTIEVGATSVASVPVRLRAPEDDVRGRQPLVLRAKSVTRADLEAVEDTVFFGPKRGRR